jgi:hypothetical protein
MLGVLDKKLKERGHCMVLVEDNEDDEALSLRAVRKCGVDCDVSVIRHGGEAITRLVSSFSTFICPDTTDLRSYVSCASTNELAKFLLSC